MTPPVLCILQARLASTRLPNKMLAKLGDETLIARGWRLAFDAFGAGHCVVAIPAGDDDGPLGAELRKIGATVFASARHPDDVLGRFVDCAHTYRWLPESVIVRYTPDDPFKDPAMMQRVAAGERFPVEVGAEAFTLKMLDDADGRYPVNFPGDFAKEREHLTLALFPIAPPKVPAGVWTIDTEDDLIAARKQIKKAKAA